MNRMELFIVLGLVIVFGGLLTGCSGIGASAEIYRIDERQAQNSTKALPLKCLFVECGTEAKGS